MIVNSCSSGDGNDLWKTTLVRISLLFFSFMDNQDIFHLVFVFVVHSLSLFPFFFSLMSLITSCFVWMIDLLIPKKATHTDLDEVNMNI